MVCVDDIPFDMLDDCSIVTLPNQNLVKYPCDSHHTYTPIVQSIH